VISYLKRCERWLALINTAIVFSAIAVVVLFTFGQAVDRYLLKTAFSAHDQVAKIGLVWLVFTGTAAAYTRHENLRIDLIAKYLSPNILQWRETLFEIAIFCLCLLIHIKAWDVINVASFQQIMGTPFTNMLPYSAILLGTATIAFSCLIRIISTLSSKKESS